MIVRFFLTVVILSLAHANFSASRSTRLLAELRRTPLGQGRNLAEIRRALSVLRKEFPRCQPRVCIAIDGSASVSPRDYMLQKNFAQVIAGVLGSNTGSRFGSYEYGGIVKEISGVTVNLFGRNGFLARVRRARQTKSRLTFVGPGISRCALALGRGGKRKIVLLGDGRSNFAPDNSPFGAKGAVQNFRRTGGDVCGVVVGGGRRGRRFFENAVGRPRSVSSLPNWTTLGNAITKTVREVCG